MVREIVTDAEQLSERCDEVEIAKQKNNQTSWFYKDKEELDRIIVDLKQTLREHKNGVGLSANQIGYNKRVFCLNYNGDIRTYVNPVIVEQSQMGFSKEGCLSIPDKQFIIPRANKILVNYLDPLGNSNAIELNGFAAHVFQHELDHLNGVLLSDLGLEIGEDFENATPEEQDELLMAYKESLEKMQEQVNKEIEEDEELSQTQKAIEFMEKVQTGKIEIEQVEVDEKTKEEINKKLEEKPKTRKRVKQDKKVDKDE